MSCLRIVHQLAGLRQTENPHYGLVSLPACITATLESVAAGPLTLRTMARQRLECVRFIAALSRFEPRVLGQSGDKSLALQTLRDFFCVGDFANRWSNLGIVAVGLEMRGR